MEMDWTYGIFLTACLISGTTLVYALLYHLSQRTERLKDNACLRRLYRADREDERKGTA